MMKAIHALYNTPMMYEGIAQSLLKSSQGGDIANRSDVAFDLVVILS